MAEKEKPLQPRSKRTKKKPGAAKKTGVKAAVKKKPAVKAPVKKRHTTAAGPSAKTTADALPYKVENPLVKDKPKNTAADPFPAEAAGMSGLERIIHFFARHDESGKEVEKAPEKKEEEIDPEALERGDVPMSFVDHLGEFRSRLLISIIFILILTIAGFIFSDHLLYFINRPFMDTGLKLNVFKLSEGFMMRIKAGAISALLVGLPFVIFQGWRFVLPAIAKGDRWFGRLSLLASVILFYTGVAFVYFLLMPFAVKMLLSFVAKDITSVIGASEYISFVFLFCFLMGVLFEFPIVIMILTRIGIVTPTFLSSNRKWAIVIVFVISAVITPTQDVLTQAFVAVPLMFLFEISIIVSRMTVVRKKKKQLERERQDA
ncbi:MAG: twin-arginine translocase subunit TatC [Spirochaetes bacterium]|nr:twin-arginine translocase subunit TatC [Spirochaetota bacterium]